MEPFVKYNNKIYFLDKITRWNNNGESGNWLITEHSECDLVAEFTVNENKFVAIYKQAVDDDTKD